jgi:sugar phosphate isomerase/epimerase
MNNFTRRRFLQTSAMLMGASLAASAFDFDIKIKPLRLSFSTLGCPDWSFDQIIEFAKLHAYTGIEVRGIQREMDLPKCPIFTNQRVASTLAKMEQADLQFVDLGSSAALHIAGAAERSKSLDEARRFIDLAQQINCPYVRVFPNNFPKEQEKLQTIELIIAGLNELASHARGSKVTVLMETHGDLVHSDDILNIMQSTVTRHTGIIWDITNMWTVTKESPEEAYQKLKKFIRHTHIKDAKLVDGKPQYTLMGKGEVPIFDAIELLRNDGYKGYYSFEWEKLWHPEIAEPEVAIADYATVMKQKFG